MPFSVPTTATTTTTTTSTVTPTTTTASSTTGGPAMHVSSGGPSSELSTPRAQAAYDPPVYSRRKRGGSVMDYRPSAICIGSVGGVIIVSVITVIVAMDFAKVHR